MTKPLSKEEKERRAKARYLAPAQAVVAAHMAKDKATANAKKRSGRLTRSECDDMNAAVAYIKLTNYPSVNDLCSNVERLVYGSRAAKAIANAVERGLIRGYRHPQATKREATRFYPADGKAPDGKASAKPKKASSPKLNNNDTMDMEDVVSYVLRRGPKTVTEVSENVQGLSPADARRAVANAVRLGKLNRDRNIYYNPDKLSPRAYQKAQAEREAKKPSAAARTIDQDMDRLRKGEMTNKEEVALVQRMADARGNRRKMAALAKLSMDAYIDMEHVVLNVDKWGYVDMDQMAVDLPGVNLSRAVANATKRGLIGLGKLGYYLIGEGSKEAPTDKSVSSKLSDKDLADVDEIVDYIFVNCPDDSTPVTTEHLGNGTELSRSAARQACMNGVKTDRLVRDGDGYRLVGAYKAAMTPAEVLVRKEREALRETGTGDTDAPIKEAAEKLARTLQELAAVKEVFDESRKQSATVEAALREKVELLEGEIVGWELRSNVQVLTYRFERWEHDRLRAAYAITVNWLESWLDGMDSNDSGEWSVDDWRGWARRQADGLRRGLGKMKPFQKREQPMTDVKPEPPENLHKMLAYLVSNNTMLDIEGMAARKAGAGG